MPVSLPCVAVYLVLKYCNRVRQSQAFCYRISRTAKVGSLHASVLLSSRGGAAHSVAYFALLSTKSVGFLSTWRDEHSHTMAVHCTFMNQPPAALDCVHDLHPCVSIQSACLYLCVIGTRSPLAYSTTSLACLCVCAQSCCSFFLRYLLHGCRVAD